MTARAYALVLSTLAFGCAGDGAQASETEGAETGSGGLSTGQATLPVTATGAETQTGSTTLSTSSVTSTGSTVDTNEPASSEEGSSTGYAPEETACDVYDAYVELLEAAADNEERQSLTDAFVSAGQYSDTGFPLRCEGRTVFFFTGAASAAVAGQFNDWDPSADPMVPVVDGFGALALELDLSADAGAYKMVTGEEMFVADPLARRFDWDEFGEFSLVGPSAERGHHERWPGFSEGVGELEPRGVTVFVPQQVNANPETDVPVLYLHDGQNAFSPDAPFGGWRVSETLEAVMASQSVSPLLMVAIDNTAARLDEYSHVSDTVGGATVGGRADEYADFLVTGIKPFIDERYPARPGPEFTGVLGSSMGGLVSLILGQRHPEVFGYAGSMSGTLGWGTFGAANETIVQRYADAPPAGLSIYVDSGGEGPCPEGGSDNYCENVGFAEALRSEGWTDEADLFYRWEPGAGHNEAAWAGRFGAALIDWFPGPLPRNRR